MNKKFAAVLAATCVLGATTAFAANPFSDVTPNDWAYQAVAQLAAEGVIDGYPDGTFKGERNITRYEMAQMVARAMAHQDQVDAEQQAQIDRLANEFANELNSLGVRVSNLENRVGNVKVTGDARMRYLDTINFKGDSDENVTAEKASGFDARVRLDFNAKVSEKTEAVAGVEANIGLSGQEDANADLTLNKLYVKHNLSDQFSVMGGRYDLTLGATGVFYDDSFDGISAAFGDKFQVEAGYGRLRANYEMLKELYNGKYPDAWYVQVGTDLKEDVTAKAFYLHMADGKDEEDTIKFSFWGAGVDAKIANALRLSGDYVKGTGTEHAAMWNAGLHFGVADTTKVGSFELGASYYDVEPGAYLGGSGHDLTSPMDLSAIAGHHVKYWQASAAVVPFENSKLKGYYNFDIKADGEKVKDSDMWGVELNYFF